MRKNEREGEKESYERRNTGARSLLPSLRGRSSQRVTKERTQKKEQTEKRERKKERKKQGKRKHNKER
jgi:hypothetical protein